MKPEDEDRIFHRDKLTKTFYQLRPSINLYQISSPAKILSRQEARARVNGTPQPRRDSNQNAIIIKVPPFQNLGILEQISRETTPEKVMEKVERIPVEEPEIENARSVVFQKKEEFF